MRFFLLPLLLLLLLITGCSPGENQSIALQNDALSTAQEAQSQLTVENLGEYNGKDKMYQEIETKLTKGYYYWDEGKDGWDRQDKEVERLKKEGVGFRHDKSQQIQTYRPMYELQKKCSSKGTDCKIIVFSPKDKQKFPEYTFGECHDGNESYCEVIRPQFPPNAVAQDREFELYGADKDLYIVGSNVGDADLNYTFFQNDKKIFSHDLWPEHGLIKEASIILGSPAFGFSDIKDKEKIIVQPNIFYKRETINDKYGLEGSNFLFSFKDKVGFIGKKNGKNFIVFNGQKISKDFDEIGSPLFAHFSKRRYYPIKVYENGILFFTGKRGEKYFFTEINLHEYL